MQASNYEGRLINSCSLSMSEMPLLLACKMKPLQIKQIGQIELKSQSLEFANRKSKDLQVSQYSLSDQLPHNELIELLESR